MSKKKRKQKTNSSSKLLHSLELTPIPPVVYIVVVSYGWLGDPEKNSFLQMALLGRYVLVQVVVLLLYTWLYICWSSNKNPNVIFFFIRATTVQEKGNAVLFFLSFSTYDTLVGNSIATPFFLLNSTREYQARKMLLLLYDSLLLLHPFR